MSLSKESASPSRSPCYHVVQRFGFRSVFADLVAAAAVSLAISAPISMVDKSIIDKVNGTSKSIARGVWNGARTAILHPHKFFWPCAENQFALAYWLVFSVYFGTYASANITQSYCEAHHRKYNFAKFVSSSATNMYLCVLKDVLLLKCLPNPNKAQAMKRVPGLSRSLFFVRDALTTGTAFCLTQSLTEMIVRRYKTDYKSTNDAMLLLLPCSIQLVSTPIHLAAIGYKNLYPIAIPKLMLRILPDYPTTALVRMGRILPAFGFGGMINYRTRDFLDSRLDATATARTLPLPLGVGVTCTQPKAGRLQPARHAVSTVAQRIAAPHPDSLCGDF